MNSVNTTEDTLYADSIAAARIITNDRRYEQKNIASKVSHGEDKISDIVTTHLRHSFGMDKIQDLSCNKSTMFLLQRLAGMRDVQLNTFSHQSNEFENIDNINNSHEAFSKLPSYSVTNSILFPSKTKIMRAPSVTQTNNRETFKVISTNKRGRIHLQFVPSKNLEAINRTLLDKLMLSNESHSYMNDDPITLSESTPQTYQTDLPPHKKMYINPFILPDQLESDPRKHNLSESQIRLGKEYQKNKGKKMEPQLIGGNEKLNIYSDSGTGNNNGKIAEQIIRDGEETNEQIKHAQSKQSKSYYNSVSTTGKTISVGNVNGNLPNAKSSTNNHQRSNKKQKVISNRTPFSSSQVDENISITDNDGFPPFVDEMPSGPFFEMERSNNITALRNHSANLNCRVNQIGNRTVSSSSNMAWSLRFPL